MRRLILSLEFALAVALLSGCGSQGRAVDFKNYLADMEKVKEISTEDGYFKTQRGVLLVDVREREEVEELAYDVLNSLNIPLSELSSRYKEIPKDAEVIVACRAGGRSAKAATFLAEKGYTNVESLQGGIVGWVRSLHRVIKK